MLSALGVDDHTGVPVRVGSVVRPLMFIEVTSGFLQYGMVPLLPRIGERLGVSAAELSWAIAVQLLCGAVCVPVLGRLGDRYGHLRMLRATVVLVATGTVLVALAPSFVVLVAGLVLKGPLAALLPLEVALVRGVLPVAAARRAIGLLVGALTLGALLGAVTTGAVATATGSDSVALSVLAVMTLACIPLSLFAAFPRSPGRPEVRMDWPGAALLGAGTVSLLIGLSQWEESGTASEALVVIGLGVALLVVFCVVELRVAQPLIDLRATVQRQVLPYYLVAGLFGVVYFGSQAPTTVFLAADPEVAGYGFGLSAFAISLVLLPSIASSIVGSFTIARIARRIGYRACVVLAFALLAVGFTTLALVRGQLFLLCLTMPLVGFAIGLALGAMPIVIVESAPPDRSGIATALYNNTKLVGGALAGGVFAALLARATPPGGDMVREGGFVTVWLIAAVCAAVAALAAAHARPGRPRPLNHHLLGVRGSQGDVPGGG